ncbi:hypothetical protein BJ165DRAFT_1533375 [Panaeolus papilionaceus]|nr:hypothetical protein BJ165DRAFT_1533375 [Panaeolus papilionaceus]
MYSEPSFSFATELDNLSLQPLVTAARTVLEDLSPLLATDSPVDNTPKEQLRKIFESFAKGVELACVMAGHTVTGVLDMMDMLKEWDSLSPQLRLKLLESVAQRFLFAEVNGIDGRAAYVEAKRSAEPLVKQLQGTYGPDTVVEVTSVGEFTKELNFAKTTIRDIGTRVILHIDKSESRTDAFVNFLQGSNKALRDFLEDENISLTQPPTQLPFLSTNPLKTWQVLNSQLIDVMSQFTQAVQNNMNQLETGESSADLVVRDFAARRPKYVPPNIKIQAPESKPDTVKQPRTHFPSDLVQTALMSDGDCVIHIASIDQKNKGTSTVKFVFLTRATRSWVLRPQGLAIHCKVIPDEESSPVRIASHHPSNVKELRDDSHFQPPHCHPHLNILTSDSSVDWNFSRPVFHWTRGTLFPTNLSVELDVEHTVGIVVQVRLVFTYRRLFIWKVVETVPSGIYAPAETSKALTIPART